MNRNSYQPCGFLGQVPQKFPQSVPVNSPKVDEIEKVRVSPIFGWESPRNCGFPNIWLGNIRKTVVS